MVQISPLFTIFALSAGYLLTNNQYWKTGNQNPPSGGFWLPVFPILIFSIGKQVTRTPPSGGFWLPVFPILIF